jgi:hypothetical protein
LTRCKISERVTVHHLLEKAGMTSVNRMAATTIIMEMWRTMGGNSVEKKSLALISSLSTLMTRSRTEGKLEVGTLSTCYVHHGVKLWNNTSRAVKDAKTKWAAKKAVKEYICGFSM